MKFTPGIAVGAMSGSIGGSTASHNAGGAYFRTRVVPVNPQTPAQTTVRSNLSNASARWGGVLTQIQRDGWVTFAENFPIVDRLGQALQLSGQQAYVRLNSRLLAAELPFLDDAPIDQNVTDLLTVEATWSIAGAKLDIAFTPTPLAADDYLIVRATPAFSPGKNYFTKMLRVIVVSAAAQASPLDVLAEWQAKFGAVPAVGSKIGFEINVIRATNGAYDAVLRTTMLVTA